MTEFFIAFPIFNWKTHLSFSKQKINKLHPGRNDESFKQVMFYNIIYKSHRPKH